MKRRIIRTFLILIPTWVFLLSLFGYFDITANANSNIKNDDYVLSLSDGIPLAGLSTLKTNDLALIIDEEKRYEEQLIDSQIEKLNNSIDEKEKNKNDISIEISSDDGDIIEEVVLQDIYEVPDNIAYASSDKEFIGYFTRHSDLQNQIDISAEEMDYIIDKTLAGRKSILKGCGQAFIDASNETGLSPLFLLALTANEAGWVVNPAHARKNNPYSINMTNTTGTKTGYVFGNNYGDGIIKGAMWINEKYYLQGQTTLNLFIHGRKSYCVPGEPWINAIVGTMNSCYRKLINKRKNLI